ncbi:MAG: response regulator [Elusimicrobiaceae bacterium]|nr:response regulator [Elusimicrobiaceae bacterium]
MTAKRKILIIDTPKGARRMEQLLDKAGYSLRSTSVKADADTAVNIWKPDLILVNIFLHEFNTSEFIEAMQKLPGAQNIKILVVSEEPDIALVTGEHPAVQGYLPKPIDFGILNDLIKATCGKGTHEHKPTVLLADDDQTSSDLIRRFLEIEYYRPVQTSTVPDTLRLIEQEAPAALIIAPLLADGTGLGVIKQLRKTNKDLPIIVVSALKLGEPQERGYLTGHTEFAAQKIPDSYILETVARLLAAETEQRPAETARPRVLIADDQPMLLSLMREMLSAAGFEVRTAEEGNETLKLVYEFNPEIVVLDYALPFKTGFDITLELRANPLYANTPIMILTAVSDKQLKLKGLSLGIDDYMIKPVDTDELIARIRMILKRTRQVLDSNPLTKLPGNPSIQAHVERRLTRKEQFAVLYLDLDNFKAFNDIYGFDAGDKVIQAAATLIVTHTKKSEGGDGFIGHIGGDDFIAACSLDKAEEIARNIIRDFDAIAPSFYSEADRARGYIVTEDRLGKQQRFPLISISIGIAHNRERELTSFTQISEIGSELKHRAKQETGSKYIIDRRKNHKAAA